MYSNIPDDELISNLEKQFGKSFKASFKKGYGIETDIHATKDEKFVLENLEQKLVYFQMRIIAKIFQFLRCYAQDPDLRIHEAKALQDRIIFPIYAVQKL